MIVCLQFVVALVRRMVCASDVRGVVQHQNRLPSGITAADVSAIGRMRAIYRGMTPALMRHALHKGVLRFSTILRASARIAQNTCFPQ